MRFLKPALLPFLFFPLISGCSDNSPGRGPRDVLFAYGNGDGLYILRGDGTLKQKVIGGYYYQPVLSPDKTKVACVYDKDFQITIFNLDGNFESQGKPKTVFNPQALSQGSQMSSVCCPVWSTDGQKVYFLNMNHLIVYDYQEKKAASIFDFPDIQTGGQTPETGNMKLSKDGGSLFCMLSEGKDKLAFWTISPGGNQGTQVANMDRGAFNGLKFPGELSGEFVERLFGSNENPKLGAITSTDNRYFFYFREETGFLAKQTIQGFDKTTKENFEVVAFGTSIYSK